MGKKIVGIASKAAGPKGSARRRWSLLLSLVLAIGASMVIKQTLFAVHSGTPFELDHVVTNAGPPPTGPGANVTSQTGDDWDKVCYAETGDASCGNTNSLAASVTATAWTADCPRDPNTGLPQNGLTCGNLQATFFQGGGSKDPEPISAWAWKDDSGGIPDKDNLLHAFAVRYVVPSSAACPGPGGNTNGTTNCDVLYFGSDRFANDGDAQQGFWFLQSPVTLGTNAVGGGSGFTGTHMNGDLLVISDFSNGGTTSTITVYKWNSACLGDGKPLATCSSANLQRLTPANQNSSCYTQLAGDPFCGVVNNVGGVAGQPPWDFLNKAGQATYDQNELFEAGVNLSTLGLASECFATVVSETRTSTSPSARLMDFVIGSFGECTAGMVTAPVLPTGRTSTTVLPGDSVADSVTQLTITGTQSWTGTIRFFVCSPSELDDAGTLPGGGADDPNTCDIGGTKLGDDISVSGNPINPALPIVSTVSVTVNTVGTWCFRGEFDSGTTNVPDASDFSSGECFTVIKLQPSMSTAQTWTVKDSAEITVSGGGNLTGNLVFQLWDAAGCSGTKLYDSGNIAVSGASPQTKSTDNAASATGSLEFTAATVPVGQLSWLVTYTSTNSAQKGVIHTCGSEKSTLTINNGSSSTMEYPTP